MKKLYTIWMMMLLSAVLYLPVSGQYCGSSGTCTPANKLTSPGFEHPDTTPCIIQGMAYDHAVQILMYSNFSFGVDVEIDSVEFVSITNLPCGLCWNTNKPNNKFKRNEYGCIRIAGTTTDSAGLYKLGIFLRAWLTGGDPNQPTSVPPSLVNAAGVKMFLRVQAAESSIPCPSVDTSSSAALITAEPCTIGINDVAGNISSLSIVPNPLSSNGTIVFTASQPGNYTLTLTDMTGKVINTRQLNAVAGENRTAINRQNISTGVYLLTLSNGTQQVTRKFTVVD